MSNYDVVPAPACAVGESPFWHAREQAWYWVDIPARAVWRYDPANGALRSWTTPQMVACIAPMASGGLIAGMETGLFHLALGAAQEAQATPLAAPEDLGPGMRFNDGRCDRQGRFWAGTMVMDMAAARADGNLYRYDERGLSAPVLDGLLTQNGLAWSPDGRTMYLSDSHPRSQTVWAFDYDCASGVPSRRRVFIDMHQYPGRPDGAAMDTDGCYWTCANDAGLLLRFAPDGRLDRRIEVPMSKPAMCSFGGADLDTLLVVSISAGQPPGAPWAGTAILLRPGAQGTPEAMFRAEARAEPWGATAAGVPAARIVLENAVGTRAVFTEFGATLCALHVPDRSGRFANVVLGLPSLAAYEASRRRMGCVIGRYAGRIGGASFELDGKSYRLHRGPAGPALHGGPDGFDRRLWKHCLHVDRRGAQVGFVLVSPDGDQRFPGTLEVEVSYRLPLERHALEISYRARTDAPTVINLTNHAFFNLRGAGAQGLRSHRFRIDASRIAHTDLLGVPTGVLDPVEGTDADFTRLQALRAAAGHDCSYVFDDARSVLRPVALIEETESGRRMAVHTTEPSAQFFTGNGFDGSETGAEGRAYLRHDGFAFETQHLPDSPNHPSFPTTALYPGQEYRSVTILEFTA